jgi:hypothetical protein
MKRVSDRPGLRGYPGCGGEGCVFSANSARQVSVLSAIKAVYAEDAEKISRRPQRRRIPRVRAETPAPPALRKERIGKEAPAGMFPPASLFLNKLLAVGF